MGINAENSSKYWHISMKTQSFLTKKGHFERPFLWICYCGYGRGLIFIEGHEEAAAVAEALLYNLKQKSHFQLFLLLWSESNRQTFLLLASKAFLCRLACFLRGLRLSRNSQSEALIRRKGIVCPKKCPAFSGIVKHQQILDLVITLWAQFGTTYYVLHLQVYSIYRRDVYNFYIFAFISKSFLHFLDRRIRGAFYGTTRYFFYPICHKNFSHIYQINDILHCIMYTLTFLN